MPKNIQEYTHRIGRTGRAGLEGLATSFLTNDDSELFYEIKEMLQKTGNQVPYDLRSHPAANVKPGQPLPRKRDTVIYTH
mmetsp:Transcript_6526/g.7094  ORF Transcript_6526/g.7094 Transcript_6526/m.7094 type:complete len:80 (+) Transcript_6526:187-426(+)